MLGMMDLRNTILYKAVAKAAFYGRHTHTHTFMDIDISLFIHIERERDKGRDR